MAGEGGYTKAAAACNTKPVYSVFGLRHGTRRPVKLGKHGAGSGRQRDTHPGRRDCEEDHRHRPVLLEAVYYRLSISLFDRALRTRRRIGERQTDRDRETQAERQTET